jgi:F0F1-type ATP synthase membrane subunit c/vacuolar-type H+-ATPase subunit K
MDEMIFVNIFCRAPSIVSDLYGNDHWGANYAIFGLGPAAGSFLFFVAQNDELSGGLFFSTFLVGIFYDKYSLDGGISCYGRKCYYMTFVIAASLCMVALICGIVLSIKARKRYKLIEFVGTNATVLNSH